MNLSPDWAEFFTSRGIDAVHWSSIGSPSASDSELMNWARANGRVVLTHDLDFGALLAIAGGSGPSVVQVRAQDVLPAALGARLLEVLRDFALELELGALVTVDEASSRVRMLPIRSRE